MWTPLTLGTITLGISSAAAADIARFPLRAEVAACEDCAGVRRLSVPLDLRSPGDPSEGTDLLLMGPEAPVPVAWIRGEGEVRTVHLSTALTEDPAVLRIRESDRPIDGLRVRLADDDSAATVQVAVRDGRTWRSVGAPTLVWRHALGDQRDVALPAVHGELRVTLQHHHREPSRAPYVEGLIRPRPAAEPLTETLPVTDWRLEESGWARYTVDLPARRPAGEITLHVEEPIFEREVAIHSRAVEDWEEPDADHRVRRLRIGSARAERIRMPTGPLLGEQLIVYVEAAGQAPLTIPEVTLHFEGVDALVADPGDGPLMLYGGAPAGTSPVWDLQIATAELARLSAGTLDVGSVEDNPAHIPEEIRTGLALPSTVITVADFGWRRSLPAAGAAVRVPLDEHALAHARPDLGDVRLVDGEGRQIPHVIRRRAVDNPWSDATEMSDHTRVEEGSTSLITVPIPTPDVPVARITLSTDALRFSRDITVLRARGDHLEPLRRVEWVGTDRPGHLTLDVGRRVGEALLVRIDNGDNPPLPITDLSLAWPAWEAVAWLPDTADSALIYGDPQATRPDYDLAAMAGDLARRAPEVVTPGAPEAITPPPRSPLDRALLLGGIAVLVLGLAGLTARLVRGIPETEPA